jgi:hypothetical protein
MLYDRSWPTAVIRGDNSRVFWSDVLSRPTPVIQPKSLNGNYSSESGHSEMMEDKPRL